MNRVHVASACLILLLCGLLGQAQQTVATNTNVAVPPLINFSGALTDANGKPITMTGAVAVTFSLYSEQTGGAALWMETQNVQLDSRGNYTVMLGSTSSVGLPSEIFVAGQAHWLGVQVQGQPEEQPRVLLVSAPYALKAGDAETIGGLPPSAFVLAAPAGNGASTAASNATPTAGTSTSAGSLTTSDVTTTGGTVSAIPIFTTSTNIQNSLLTQTAKTINVGGKLNLPATGTATSSAGKNSQPQDFVASAYDSSTAAGVAQTFQLQAEPAGNDTSSPSGTLNVLFGSGKTAPAETGLKISSTGLITFATGQTFPGTGDGTITGVTAGTDLTGGGTSGKVTLNLDTAKVPQLAANNTFTGTQTINNNVTVTATGTTLTASGGELGVSGSGSSTGVYGASDTGTGIGIYGTSNSGGGVYGISSSGDGVYGLSGTGAGIYGASTAGNAVVGVSPATSGATHGVYGSSASSTGYGVQGSSPYVGVYGLGSGASKTSATLSGAADAGVWGDTGGSADTYSGVVGTADDNNAGYFENNSGSDTNSSGATLYAENDSGDESTLIFAAEGFAGDDCAITTGGDLSCSGTVGGAVRGGDGARKVMVHAVQSPENWFEDFGSGTLANGAATVALDPTFASTVNTTTDYHVFLTPRGECEGLYIANTTATSFEVRELHHGSSSVAFDYRIVAKRAGYENQRLEDVTERYQKMQEDQRLRRERMQQRRAAQSAAEPVVSATIPLHK
jgi:hypothetical protein